MVANTEYEAGPALQALELHRLQSIEMTLVFFPRARHRIKKPAQSDLVRNFSGRIGLPGVLAMGRVGPYTPRPLADDSTWS